MKIKFSHTEIQNSHVVNFKSLYSLKFILLSNLLKLLFYFHLLYIIVISMFEQQTEVYEFTITIKQIKLAVKFPCKLTLIYQNKTIKADVPVNQSGKYIIERQFKTKSQNNQPIEILIHLTTQKGGNIMAGIIKLNPKDLSHSEGQSLTLSLQKCLDQSANCLLKIDRVWVSKNSKAKSVAGQYTSRNRKPYGDQLYGSLNKIQPVVVDNYRNIETRSQLPGFNLKKPQTYRKQGNYDSFNQANKLYGLGPKSYVPQIQLSKSKNADRSSDFRKQGKYRIDDDKKTAVGKRQIDPAFRLTVEANEKNLKMDIMKYKMKAQEHEKTIEDKNKLIKQLKQQIAQLHRQSVEKGFYQQEINSKNQTIQKLQDTSKQLNKQNSRLQTKIIELQRALDETKANLQSSLQRAKDEKQRRQMQLGKQLTLKKDEISLLIDQLKSKNTQITRIKKIIEDLQKSLQAKTFDYEKAIQSQRGQMNKLQALLNEKIKQLQEMNRTSVLQKENLQSQLKKKAEQVTKLQSQTNHLMSELKQVTELQKYYASYKVKFTDLEKAYEKLYDEKKQVEKHYLKLMETKEKDYGEFKEEQSGLIVSYKKKNTELTQKTKQQSARIMQLENKTTMLVTEMDKLKRTLEMAQKQLTSLTENWKAVNQSLKQKDEQLLQKQKQLSELESKLSNRQSLMKKDIEYKTQQLGKVSAKLSEYQHLYRQEKQTNETLRFDTTKIEGKNKLQEEIIARLNRQLEETKAAHEKRETDYKEELKQINEKVKLYEQMQKKYNKQITQCQMLDLNRKNDINRLNKELQIRNQKIQRLTKKLSEQEQLIKELNQTNARSEQKIIHVERELKDLHNNKRALEADFTKTQKIKTIIVEEKTSVQNELANLKKQIENKITIEQTLNKEIKQLKEELAKMTLKANNSAKDFQTFKENLYNTIQASLYSSNGNSVNKTFNFSVENSIKDSPQKSHRRYTSTTNVNDYMSSKMGARNMSESQILRGAQQRPFMFEPRFNEIIQSYGRQSQQVITTLNDSARKYKSQVERLQRQSANLSSRLQSLQQQSTNTIASLERQIQSQNNLNNESSNQWEEKLLVSERTNRQKEQIIEELNDELESLHHQLAANSRTSQIQLQELALKIEQLKGKNYDLEAKVDFSSMTILSYEEKIFTLESMISQVTQQLQYEKQKVDRKDKLIVEHTSRIEELTKLAEENKKQKLQLTRELTLCQEKLQAEKENSMKHKKLLQQEEEKNKEIKGFNNNLLKEKQSIVKNQLIKSERVIELEDTVSKQRQQKDQLFVENENKSKIIIQLKTEVKRITQVVKERDEFIEKSQHQILKLQQTIKEKQKKIQQKQLQIKNIEINLQKAITKYEQDTKKINQQHQQTMNKFKKELQEKKTRIIELTSEVQKLTHLEKKLSEQNISLEEQIFFERQTNSLANSKFQAMNREIEDAQKKLAQAIREIENLNEEVRDREQKMFQLSNKLYAQDSQLEMKDIQMREKLQKLDTDWKNKYEETLEDYEVKIQSIERQKFYLREKLEEEMQEISKLQNDKRNLVIQEEKEKKVFEEKIKKIQNDRLTLLVQKNKQIERLRQEIEQVEERVKAAKHQKDIKDDQIRRLEEKVRQKDQRLLSNQDKTRQAIVQLEKELEFQKKKQSQLSKYKEFIKNNIWSSERQIKRILQSYMKNIMLLCQEQKKKDLMEIIKLVQGQIVKAIEFNLEEA